MQPDLPDAVREVLNDGDLEFVLGGENFWALIPN